MEQYSVGIEIKNNVYRMECTCGYKGLAARKKCIKCKKRADILLKGEERKTKIIVKTMNEIDGNFVFACHGNVYFKAGNVSCEKYETEFLLSTDLQTGDTKIIHDGQEKEVFKKEQRSFIRRTNRMMVQPSIFELEFPGLIKREYYNDLHEKSWEAILVENKKIATIYLTKLFELRGVKYKKVEPFLENKKTIRSAFVLAKFPVLQHLPFYKYDQLTEEMVEILETCQTPKDVWEKLTGHYEPSFRKLVAKENFDYAMIWGPVIKETNNLVYRLKELFLNANKKEKIIFETYLEFNKELFLKGIQAIKKNSKESVWVKKIRKKEKVDESAIIHCIEDIGRMYEQIIEKNNEYKLPKWKNAKDLHDQLVRDHRRIQTSNLKIRLTEKEKKYEEKIEEFNVYLPRETHELIEIGEKLENCVASYRNSALNKTCTIAVLRKGLEPVVCMELRGDVLHQAKAKYNRRPGKAFKEIIQQWMVNHGIESRTLDVENPDKFIDRLRNEGERERYNCFSILPPYRYL